MKKQRQLIYIYLKDRKDPLVWSPQPGREKEDFDKLLTTEGVIHLEDEEGFIATNAGSIQALMGVNQVTHLVEPTLVELAKLAIEQGYTSIEFFKEIIRLLKEDGRATDP